jgi:hypothetical protein
MVLGLLYTLVILKEVMRAVEIGLFGKGRDEKGNIQGRRPVSADLTRATSPAHRQAGLGSRFVGYKSNDGGVP